MDTADFDAAMAATEALSWVEVEAGERWTTRLDLEGGALCAEVSRNHGGAWAGSWRARAWVEFQGAMRTFPQPRGGVPGAPDRAYAQREIAGMFRMYLVSYWRDGVNWM